MKCGKNAEILIKTVKNSQQNKNCILTIGFNVKNHIKMKANRMSCATKQLLTSVILSTDIHCLASRVELRTEFRLLSCVLLVTLFYPSFHFPINCREKKGRERMLELSRAKVRVRVITRVNFTEFPRPSQPIQARHH